ncbi:hypothetical protein D3C75_1182800 [compost metagenome]|uniref:Uncharacterized protein n=1 Tax=Paenibacillus jilunlii TaxID=682956 RepID=A0A1G9GL52_9BACL|nr:hypothetical protein [Paenibacillus jilunlii]KWX78631.1 hypothetical protein AML91_04870 [Paenibacillus jilunlii]SDL00993.1 hypothetical protein SAMN05216191_101447 [Paenibacillus jilunlii]
MQIGLIRHFKVKPPSGPFWMSAEQFSKWILEYEQAELLHTDYAVTDYEWNRCLCSDQGMIHPQNGQLYIYEKE